MIIHPEMASALARQHQDELIAQAARHHREPGGHGTRQSAGLRVPRYRVNWSRTTLSPADAAGGRGRSWVIVISATRGL